MTRQPAEVTSVMRNLAGKLRSARVRAGLTQTDAAVASGVGEKLLSAFETGRRIKSLKVRHLLALLLTYGMTIDEFFAGSTRHFADSRAQTLASLGEQDSRPVKPRAARAARTQKFHDWIHYCFHGKPYGKKCGECRGAIDGSDRVHRYPDEWREKFPEWGLKGLARTA